jgi:hypothetical protein
MVDKIHFTGSSKKSDAADTTPSAETTEEDSELPF